MPFYKQGTSEIGNKSHGADWIEYTVGQEPAELKALLDAEVMEEARQAEKTARETALNSMTHTLADGAVVQTRPSDLTNFQIAIDIGLSKDWVLADNTVRLLTVAEMGECLMSGIGQADVIWTAYTDFLKAN